MNIHLPRQHLPFLGVLLLALVVGLMTAPAYGQTWDDQGLWDYADFSQQNYGDLFAGRLPADSAPTNHRYYGPAFLLFAGGLQDAAHAIGWQAPDLDVWHFAIFLSFLAGLAAFYALCLRLSNPRSALWASLVFALQPLVWGHAFINAKDIPFMAAFLLAVVAGLRAADREESFAPAQISIPSQARRRFVVSALLLVGAWILLTLSAPNARAVLETLLGQLREASAASLGGRLFAAVAQNADRVPLADYAAKAWVYLSWVLGAWLVFGLLISLRRLLREAPELAREARRWLGAFKRSNLGGLLRSPRVWLAGLMLGLCLAIRVMGVFAGGLVLIYWVSRRKHNSLPFVAVYGGIAAATAYALWPFLWAAPLARFLESLLVMAHFPWQGPILFNGEIYAAAELPAYFLPQLLLMQLTLPALLLIGLGIMLAIRGRHAAGETNSLHLMLAVWFLMPLIYTILADSTMYDNFRQYLFILPPLFVYAVFAINWLAERLRPVWHQLAMAAILLAAAWQITTLFPYEYTFYNALAGGTSGAAGRFELDYWATALTAATEEVNAIAPPDGRLLVWGPEHVAQAAARPDLLVEGLNGGTYDHETGYHYALINVRAGTGHNAYPEIEPLFTIQRRGVDLAIVKALPCDCRTLEGTP